MPVDMNMLNSFLGNTPDIDDFFGYILGGGALQSQRDYNKRGRTRHTITCVAPACSVPFLNESRENTNILRNASDVIRMFDRHALSNRRCSWQPSNL